jgi:hypothetical protein
MKRPLSLVQSALREAWHDRVNCDGGKFSVSGNPGALQALAALKKPLPDTLHFIWIGNLQSLDLEYIDIWQRVNADKDINLWHDADCSYCDLFHKTLVQHAKSVAVQDSRQLLISLQNEAFHYIYPRLDANHTFNTLALEFLQRKGIEAAEKTKASSPAFAKSLGRMTLRNIADIFTAKLSHLKKYYYYEVILRGNFACASDIARLIILYHHGGIYLDVDTLPATANHFPKTISILKQQGLYGNEFATAALADAALQKIRNIARIEHSIENSLRKISNITEAERNALFHSIDEEAQPIRLATIRPLGEVLCYPQFIIQSAVPSLAGVYFSNVIGAHRGAKTLSILLRSIKKRYRYLENNNAIFSCAHKHVPPHYLSRLLGYRMESLTRSGEITLALTGPGLIVEVLLGLALHLLKPEEDIPPDFLSLFMQNDRHGIAFFDHTLHTPKGLYSSWMNGC